MPRDTAESVLKELALHLSYDAEVNGSKLTEHPFGSLALSVREGDMWKRVIDVLGYEPDMIRDVVAQAIKARA